MSLLLRTAITAALVVVFGMVGGTASAFTSGEARPASNYPVGEWLCAPMPGVDMCVWNPDPEGDPVSVEPDNDWRPLSAVMTDELAEGVRVATMPDEDDPAFDCRTHGNGVCGPGNSNGYPAGCYKRSGADAGALIRPWDAAMAADPHYRPDGCGRRTPRDRAMDALFNGQDGRLCAGTGTDRVCWLANTPRPKEANGTAYLP
jgi:hypothetical protein